jgi:hypothetical protein
VERAERDRILRQQVVLPETPRQKRELAALEEDLRSMDITGKPLPLRLRNFVSSPEAYLASAGGPLAYMRRLREIELYVAAYEADLAESWHALAREHPGDAAAFAHAWRTEAERMSFDEVNDLIERHNRWYPIESRLPMDPRTGEHALVNGREYRLSPFDAEWVLERFPAELELARAS